MCVGVRACVRACVRALALVRAPDKFTDMDCEQLATTSTTLKELQKGGAAVRLAQTATVSGGAAVRKSEFLS